MVRSRSIALLVTLTTAACSSSTTGNGTTGGKQTIQDAPCVTPGASYLIHMVQHPGGTCGALTDQVVNTNPDGTSAAASGCTNNNRVQDCDVFVDTTCSAGTQDGVTLTAEMVGKVTWAQDGSSAEGVETMTGTASDGSPGCSSTYDVTWTRQ